MSSKHEFQGDSAVSDASQALINEPHYDFLKDAETLKALRSAPGYRESRHGVLYGFAAPIMLSVVLVSAAILVALTAV
jgi:hypothetical protein